MELARHVPDLIRDLIRIASLSLIASSAAAWEYSPTQICTLSHEGDSGSVVVTYDPMLGDYAISLTRANGLWPDAPVFGILFAGPRQIQIGTDRHRVSDDQRTITATDKGFGNVLDGLEYNNFAIAQAGDVLFRFDLTDAAEPVRAFRNCGAELTS